MICQIASLHNLRAADSMEFMHMKITKLIVDKTRRDKKVFGMLQKILSFEKIAFYALEEKNLLFCVLEIYRWQFLKVIFGAFQQMFWAILFYQDCT